MPKLKKPKKDSKKASGKNEKLHVQNIVATTSLNKPISFSAGRPNPCP